MEFCAGVLGGRACVVCFWASNFVCDNVESVVNFMVWSCSHLPRSTDRDNDLSTSGSLRNNPRRAQQNPGKETRKERRPLQASGLNTARKIAWSQRLLYLEIVLC